LRDGTVYCDQSGCHLRVGEDAKKLKAKYGVVRDYCLSHLRHHVARRVVEEQAQRRRKPKPQPKPEPKPKPKITPQDTKTFSLPLIAGPKGFTTEGKVAILFGVSTLHIRKYLLATGILTTRKYTGDPTIYVSKEEVRKVLLLGAVGASSLKIIPEVARKAMFGDNEMFTRLNQGVLD
jgi:hypothetical protein